MKFDRSGPSPNMSIFNQIDSSNNLVVLGPNPNLILVVLD